MTVQKTLVWAITKLQKTSPSPSLDAEVLFSFTLKKQKEFLYTHSEYQLTKTQKKKLNNLINRRVKGEPIAYLTNTKEFHGLDFFVNKNVLIPRPETELLVEEVINKTLKQKIKKTKFKIADIGTGSGCIIISIAKSYKLKAISCYATDISKPALAVAKKNAKKHKVKIKFLYGNLLEPLKNKKIDIVVANLPYGWQQWKNNTSAQTSGLKFEPQKALFAKENGLYLYHKFFEQIANRKQKPELILGEFDPRQKIGMQKSIKKHLPQYCLEIKKDLAKLDRMFILKL
jgi:release factor glutamine methyltransferase